MHEYCGYNPEEIGIKDDKSLIRKDTKEARTALQK